MAIKTKRLILREWREDDAECLYEYAHDPRIGPICGWAVHKDLEESKKILKEILMVPESYAIIWKETDKLIGCIGAMFEGQSELIKNDKECEIGFWLGVPFWGRGIMPEALQALLGYVFNELDVDKVWCSYFDGNEQSRRVQEKCGFKYCYTIKDILWKQLNVYKTIHVNCIDKADWHI